MKLGPVTKPDKTRQKRQKHLKMTSCQKTVTSLSFFQFMANLEQSGSRILDAWSVKITFSLTFYLTKTENRTKTSLAQFSFYQFG